MQFIASQPLIIIFLLKTRSALPEQGIRTRPIAHFLTLAGQRDRALRYREERKDVVTAVNPAVEALVG